MATRKPETKKEDPKAAPAQAAPAPKKSRKKLWIGIAAGVVLLLAGGGAAAYFALQPDAAPAEGEAKAEPKKAVEKAKPALFVALEIFTVNLQPESGDHFLQTSLSLKVADPAVEQAIKLQMPEVRSRLIFVLSSKKPSELATIEGKQALANQISAEVNKTLNATEEQTS